MPERKPPKTKSLAESFEDTPTDPTDRQVAILQDRVGELENKIGEERFLWVVLFVILFDVLVFPSMGTWTAPIVIGLFELAGIVILADRCKVDAIMPLIDRLTGALGQKTKKDIDS